MRIIYRHVDTSRDIDMTPDGEFRDAPKAPLAERIFRVAVIAAVIAGGLALAALAFSFALLAIPVAIIAGLVAWATLRWRQWQGGKSFGGGQRDPFRRF